MQWLGWQAGAAEAVAAHEVITGAETAAAEDSGSRRRETRTADGGEPAAETSGPPP